MDKKARRQNFLKIADCLKVPPDFVESDIRQQGSRD